MDYKLSKEDVIYSDFGIVTAKFSNVTMNKTTTTTLFEEEINSINSTDYIAEEPIHFFILDSLTYTDPYHDFCYKTYELLKTPFDHYINWWDWFRTGKFQQPCKKKKIFKPLFICKNNFWRKMLPHKSGYVGKAMKRRKGK